MKIFLTAAAILLAAILTARADLDTAKIDQLTGLKGKMNQTEYLRYVYNRAKLLNKTAAQLALGVFQRRMASSTYALLRSLERRLERLSRH